MIEYFIVIMQDETCPVQTVQKCRKSLFTDMNRTVDNFPPTDVLLQQVCRVMLQSVIWSRSTALEEPTIDLQYWGWLADDNGELCPI